MAGSLASRSAQGGTAPSAVAAQIGELERQVAEAAEFSRRAPIVAG